MTPAVYHEQCQGPRPGAMILAPRTSSGFPVSVHGVASALLTGSQGLSHDTSSIFDLFSPTWNWIKMELVSGISHKAQKEKRTSTW